MHVRSEVTLDDVREVYKGPEGELWELVMGEQIHVGGLVSSMDLAERAQIAAGSEGVDLCCCTGAGMRFLVRFRQVAGMTGVDATETVIESGRRRCRAEGLSERIEFVCAEASDTHLPAESADFVWGEDAWCYTPDKAALIAEACRLVKPSGAIAFTDWVTGPVEMTDDEAQRLLAFMKFPSIVSLDEYAALLAGEGVAVETALDTGRYARHVDLYISMLTMQLTYDALKIIDFDEQFLGQLAEEMAFLQELARANKVIQGLIVARKGR